MGLGGQTQGEVEVVAPARGIDLAFAYSGLRFESESGLAPDARGTLRVMHSDGRDTAANLRGDLLAVCGIPGERVTFEIRFEGYEAWRAELVFPPAGEDRTVPVALAPAPAAASLELAVSAPEEAPVAAVALGLFDAGNALDANAEPLATRVAVVVDGVARFDGLDPSRTRAVVQAGDRFLSRSSHDRSYLRWIELDLDLAPGERAHRAVAFELGGRLAIVARDERGAALPAEIEVRDADGRELDVAFVAVHDSMRQGNTWRLSPLAPNETFPSLAPGEVELRLALAGFAPRTVRATVAPGRTTPVDVVLRAE
jgi:hypothetical protein